MTYAFLIIVVLFLILFLAGICADIAIIYTIFRFKRIRTAFNIFLANWAIADLLSLILIPITYGVGFIARSSRNAECVLMQAAILLHVTETLFGIVLSIDWCFAAYFQRRSETFRKHYRYVIASVWIATLLFYVIGTSLCISRSNYWIPMILFAISYSVNLIFVIVLQCSKIIQRCRKLPISYPKPLQLRLILITIVTITYLLAVISMLIMFFWIFHFVYFFYALLVVFIAACAVVSNSIITLILLCCLNYDFRKCLFQLRKPSHERFDNPGSETDDTVKRPPEISFHTSTENVVTNGNQDLVS